ncbi:FecR family protein [Sphingobium subterraneum]|uniref:Transmembrane sensor n=1 Tax=Sphingobium subterraneum TaxID=627688 RepID=A0A841J1T9_9SPHN|nr:FecR domain-containing protein [Sphingobium subterraneum]MBB6124620.1 transmembrane sensor [Sphingobium subterraneum]
MNGEDSIIDQAATWHVASTDDAMDWDGFTAWLEADPRHRAAYDELALAGSLFDEHRKVLGTVTEPAAPVAAPTTRWRGWAAGALAASLVAGLTLPSLLRDDDQIYSTGTTGRTVTLADGSSVAMAPHSRLTVSGKDGERIALSGGAYFSIRHDPGRSLSISAGPAEISDIGTVFDVQSSGQAVRIGVADGQVSVKFANVFGEPSVVGKGGTLSYEGAGGRVLIRTADTSDIGGWQKGRLSYQDTSLRLVAADLERYAGVNLVVPDTLQGRRFSGTLVIGNGQAALRDLSQLMGLELARDAGHYRLVDRAH